MNSKKRSRSRSPDQKSKRSREDLEREIARLRRRVEKRRRSRSQKRGVRSPSHSQSESRRNKGDKYGHYRPPTHTISKSAPDRKRGRLDQNPRQYSPSLGSRSQSESVHSRPQAQDNPRGRNTRRSPSLGSRSQSESVHSRPRAQDNSHGRTRRRSPSLGRLSSPIERYTNNESPSETSPRSHSTSVESVFHTETEENQNPQVTEANDEKILEFLGEEKENVNSFELHPVIANRWKSILCEGLGKEERSRLLESHLLPTNLPSLEPPKVNSHIASAIPEVIMKKDSFQINKQKQLSKGLATLGKALNLLIQNRDMEDQEIYKQTITEINASGKLLADLHFRMSLTRRALITPHLNKCVKSLTSNAPIGEFLYNTDLSERLKAAKAVEKTSKDFRRPSTSKTFSNVKGQVPLNYRRPLRNRRESQQGGRYPHTGRATQKRRC